MKFRVTLTVTREVEMEVPSRVPAVDEVSRAVANLKESVEEDPFLFIDSQDAHAEVTVDPI